MYHVPESECFTAKYRAVLRGEEIKLFTVFRSIHKSISITNRYKKVR